MKGGREMVNTVEKEATRATSQGRCVLILIQRIDTELKLTNKEEENVSR
jgi:hypothetical protein